MSTPALEQLVPDEVALRMPVAPAAGKACVASSVATLKDPLEATSQRSVMPTGGVNVIATLHAPPKMSSVFGMVVVIDGAVTRFEAAPFCCAADAFIGRTGRHTVIAAIPPDMS